MTLSGGRELKARIVGVTLDRLSVLARGVRRDLGKADVWAVAHRQEDSNANGVWIGFEAGAAFGMFTAVMAWERMPSDAGELAALAAIGGLYGAAGASAGFGVGASASESTSLATNRTAIGDSVSIRAFGWSRPFICSCDARSGARTPP